VATIRTARGKTCLRFVRTFHLCIPYVSYNKQRIFPYTAFIDCVPNGRTLRSLTGTERFFYRSQKAAALLRRKLASAKISLDGCCAQVSDERRVLYEMNLYTQRIFMLVFNALQ
jgi:hypothetical protein